MASYNVTHDFRHTLNGEARLFSKDNQTIKLKLTSQAATAGQASTTFVAILQSRNPGPYEGYLTKGTASFPRNGTKEVKWTGLPSGNYRVRFEKSTDNIRVLGYGVMSN